nr:hypothetical protein [Parachlamydiaceae bacterium]
VLPIFRPSRDVLLLVLNHLNASDLGNLCATCHHLRGRIQTEDTLWMKIANRELNIQSVFAKESWRDTVVTRKQWEKNIFQEKKISEPLNLMGSFYREPFKYLYGWSSTTPKIIDLKNANVTSGANLFWEKFSLRFYDGQRAVLLETIRTEIDPETDEEIDILNSAGQEACNSEVTLIDNKGKKIGNFHILLHPSSYEILLIDNKIIIQNNRTLLISSHEIPKAGIKIPFSDFAPMVVGIIIENTDSKLVFCQKFATGIWDHHQKTTTEFLKTPTIVNVKYQTIVQDILVQVTFDQQLIGYKKEEVEQENGSKLLQWKEIWRKENPNFNHIKAANDKSHYFLADNNQFTNEFELYDARTGESIRKMKLDIKKYTIKDPASIYHHNLLTYINRKNETVIRDFSPRKLLKIRDPNASKIEICKDKIKLKLNSYSLTKKITICCIAFFAIGALVKFFYQQRMPINLSKIFGK